MKLSIIILYKLKIQSKMNKIKWKLILIIKRLFSIKNIHNLKQMKNSFLLNKIKMYNNF